jgi:hypothetical protein
MRRLATLSSILVTLYALLGSPAAFAAADKPAAPGELTSLTQLPSDIRVVIGPDVSDRGGPFAAGCVSAHGEPHSRFVSARMADDKAQVTVERGGIAHYVDTLDFRQMNGRWVHVPKQPGQKTPPQAPDK